MPLTEQRIREIFLEELKKRVPESLTKFDTSKLAHHHDGINSRLLYGADGWITAAEEWTFASDDDPTFTITVPGDATKKYSAGMRIKLTQPTDGDKYFIITNVAGTVLTVYGGRDYNLADEAITSPFYSPHKAPLGFDLDPSAWLTFVESNSTTSQASPTPNTWYNHSEIDLPIGSWVIIYHSLLFGRQDSGSQSLYLEATLSTANNSESQPNFTTRAGVLDYTTGGADTGLSLDAHRHCYLKIATKDTYYLNFRTTSLNVDLMQALGSVNPTFIIANCAYL